MSPERFFSQAMPQLAARHAQAFASLRGTIAVSVAGAGAWTVHLGDTAQPVTPGADRGADLSLFFSAQAFGLLLCSQLDLEQAIAQRAVGYRGDLGLMEKLGYFLSAGSNADGIMLDQVPVGMKRV